MPYQITIGRNGNNKFPLQDPKVSGQHATLTVYENGKLELVDQGSTNGTFIYNGRQFVRIQPQQRYPVTPESMIQLGPDTRFHVRRLISNGGISGGRELKDPPPPVEKIDISYLRKVYTTYHETKMELESKMTANNSLRGMMIVVSLLAGTGGAALASLFGFDKDDKIAQGILGIAIAFVIAAILFMVVNSRDKNFKRQMRENNERYAVKYVCPKCKHSFGNKVYDNILAEGSCPKCKVKYYESQRP